MKRPAVTVLTLTSKMAEGNLMYWADHLREDYSRFYQDNRDLLTQDHKTVAVLTIQAITRLIDTNLVADAAFGPRSSADRRDLTLVDKAAATLNSDTVEEALLHLGAAFEYLQVNTSDSALA